MNFKEMIDGYFNSGSTDKRNKRRLGALLIGVTAILLVVCIVITAVGGVVMGIIGIIDSIGGNDNNDDGESTGNTHLIDCAVEDFATKPANTIVFDSSTPTFTTTSLARTNRPFVQDGENRSYLYGCQSAEGFGLQTEAHTAFNAMVQAFYDETQLKLFVKEAYNVGEGAVNTAYYVNALAVRLNAASAELGDLDSIYTYNEGTNADNKYMWIYENAYKFGFVQVTNTKGDENIFRYVGLANAKYIYEKQKKSDEVFYTIDMFVEEIKATTPDTKMTLTGVKSVTDDDSMKYYVYYMAVAEGAVYKLPNAKYDCTVMSVDGGYIVTYWKIVK